MSAADNCYDNAALESFWATLKAECFADFVPETKHQATLMIFDCIEGFYNRAHSSLGCGSPLEFESSINHEQLTHKNPSTLFRRKISRFRDVTHSFHSFLIEQVGIMRLTMRDLALQPLGCTIPTCTARPAKA